jgi:hypothetical protein
MTERRALGSSGPLWALIAVTAVWGVTFVQAEVSLAPPILRMRRRRLRIRLR